MQASIAMLAALHARASNPAGIYLDISMTESILAWQYLPILTRSGERATSILNGGAACYNLYQCADGGFISLGAIETAFWENFCTALNKTEWIDRQFESMPQKDLIAEVATVISSHPRQQWCKLLNDVDCCFEALLDTHHLAQQEQFVSRAALTEHGPTCPAWINNQPVDITIEFEQITSRDQLRWNSKDL